MSKKKYGLLLSTLSLLGFATTCVLVAKETPKANSEISNALASSDGKVNGKVVVTGIKNYIPAISVGTATALCVVANQLINKKEQAGIIAGYSACKELFNNYREEVIARHGEAEDQEIYESICARSISDYHKISINYPDKKVWFYEPITGQYRLMYEREIMDAEYHTNRNLMLGGCLAFDWFLDALGMDIKDDDLFGWSMYNGDYYWIDFEHVLTEDKIDGIPVFEIGYGISYPEKQPEEEMY